MKNLIENASNYCEEQEDWDDLNYLTELKSSHFKVNVENFGWRKTSGVAYVKAENMIGLLSAILPNTECTFNIFREGRKIKIQNYHHDSNTGNEWYTCVPCAESTYLRNKR